MRYFNKLIILTLIVLGSCELKKDDPLSQQIKEKASIEKTIRSSMEWAQTKDTNLLYSVIANDSNYIEVDPDNRVVKGIISFKEAEDFWLNPNFKAVKCDIRDLNIQVSSSGTVAWWYCLVDDINEWKSQPASWMNTRWTGVMEKRSGKWVIVQMHFSFAMESK